MDDKDFKVIYKCEHMYEAEIIKANLESGGIETFILDQKDRSYPTVGGKIMIKVLVSPENEADALEYINSLNNELNNENDEEEQ